MISLCFPQHPSGVFGFAGCEDDLVVNLQQVFSNPSTQFILEKWPGLEIH